MQEQSPVTTASMPTAASLPHCCHTVTGQPVATLLLLTHCNALRAPDRRPRPPPFPPPQGFSVRTRVPRRSEEFPAADRIETSGVSGWAGGGLRDGQGAGGGLRMANERAMTSDRDRETSCNP